MPVDEHQVSNVDDETCALSDDEDRVTTMNRVDGRDDSAGEREVPEHNGDVAGLLTLGGNPLHDEAGAEGAVTVGSGFYEALARVWPLVSPVEEYAGEAAEFERLIGDAVGRGASVLELGSGGGHNAFYLKRSFAMTLAE